MSKPHRASALLVAVAIALPLAGCLDGVSSRLDSLRGKEPLPPEATLTFEEPIAPGTVRDHAFPVGETTDRVDVEISLLNTGQAADFPVVAARITASLRDPSGTPVGDARELNPQNPSATFSLSRPFAAYGDHKVHVQGDGLSGQGMGATYNLTITMRYSYPPG